MKNQRRNIARLIADKRGNVLPLATIGILVSAALIGGGIDMSRAYKTENRLQAACDAGVLAGRRAVASNGFDATAEDQAEAYFDANFDEDQQQAANTSFVATSDDNGGTVTGTASTDVSTIVVDLFGMTTLDLTVDCSASMGLGNADITMVLDTTGSMAWTADGDTSPDSGETTRLADLQVAMKNFYDTVSTSASGSNTRVRYSFVPFSSSVNVGRLISDVNPDFLVDSHAVQSRVWVKWTNPVSTTPDIGYGTTTQDNNWTRITSPSYNNTTAGIAACNAAKPANTSFANNGSSSSSSGTATFTTEGKKVQTTRVTQPQRATTYSCIRRSSDNKYYVNYKYSYRDQYSDSTTTWDPSYITSNASAAVDNLVYQRFTFDTSTYKTFAATSVLIGSSSSRPSWVSSTWAGCIEERQTIASSTFSFVPGTGITPLEATDLDIDTPPDTTDDATKWAPMWPELAYYRTAGVDFSTSGTKASSACPSPSQLLQEMNETDFDAYADNLTATGNTYHDLGIIWGARLSSPNGIWQDLVNEDPANGAAVSRHMIYMTDGELNPSTTVQSTYGIERNDRRITDDGSSDQYNRHRLRFLAVCEAVKAKGIRLWVVAFGTGLTADLRTCASDGSSFAATSASTLNSAFQEIATQVGELRITQ